MRAFKAPDLRERDEKGVTLCSRRFTLRESESRYRRYIDGRKRDEIQRKNSTGLCFPLAFRVSRVPIKFDKIWNPAHYVPLPIPHVVFSDECRHLNPENLSNSCPLPHPTSTSVINSVSDVINVRCLMIVILWTLERRRNFIECATGERFCFSHVGDSCV